MEFQVGDMVLLKVSPWKGVIRFRKRGKLGPRFIGPLGFWPGWVGLLTDWISHQSLARSIILSMFLC